jgi:phytol kinase
MNPLIGLTILLLVLSGAYGGLWYCKRRYALEAETSRKLTHIGLGLMTLSFPWIFTQTWPIWLLAGISFISLLFLRRSDLVGNLGNVLHDVNRTSFGELCFPLAVAILFQLAHHHPVNYLIPMLMLTLADAFAALVGVRYGKAHYSASEGIKSVEGSFFFFLTAFMCVHIPLLLGTDYPKAQVLLVALLVSLLVTLFEAIAWKGLDNLFIPLGGYLILVKYITYPSYVLILFLASLVVITFIAFYLKKASTLNLGALLTCIVLAFFYGTLQNWEWTLLPVLMLILYAFISHKEHKELQSAHDVHTVLWLSMGALAWLFLNNALHYPLFVAFIALHVCQLSIITWIHYKRYQGNNGFTRPILMGLLLAASGFVLLYIEQHMINPHTFLFPHIDLFYFPFMLAGIIVSLVLFTVWSRYQEQPLPVTLQRLMVQGGCGFIGSAVSLGLFLLRTYHA